MCVSKVRYSSGTLVDLIVSGNYRMQPPERNNIWHSFTEIMLLGGVRCEKKMQWWCGAGWKKVKNADSSTRIRFFPKKKTIIILEKSERDH